MSLRRSILASPTGGMPCTRGIGASTALIRCFSRAALLHSHCYVSENDIYARSLCNTLGEWMYKVRARGVMPSSVLQEDERNWCMVGQQGQALH